MSDEKLRELEQRFREDPSDLGRALDLARERARVGQGVSATRWEKTDGAWNWFASVGRREVVVGSGSSRFDEGAATVTHADFLRGEHQNQVLSEHGPEVLVAMLEAVLRAPEIYASANAEIAKRQRHLARVPVDTTLAAAPLVEGAVWWAGTQRLVVSSDTHDLEVGPARPDGQPVTLVAHGTGARRPVPACRSVCAAVGIADRFYVVRGDGYCVIEPTGEVHVPADASLFGSALRLDRVSRLGDAAVFGYWWFDRNDGEPGLLKYEHGLGFVARCDR